MPAAVHAHTRQTTQVSNTTTSFTTELSISASTLTTAGFAANDDVIIIYLVNVEVDDSANHIQLQLTYDGTAVGEAVSEVDTGGAGRKQTRRWWTRVDLGGTVGDIDLDILSVDDPGETFLNKIELIVIRLSDFGVENTDWFHDKDVVLETHTAAWADTIGASITWEYFIESWTEHPSSQDLLYTTGIGWMLGELRYRIKQRNQTDYPKPV